MLRHRSEEALRRKARRGELFLTVAVGYVRVGRDEVGMDPDRRVQEAIALVFRKFAEFGSIRQVHLWLRQEGMELPAVTYGQSQRQIVWKLPVYNTVYHILTNPIYAGAYAFGRTGSRTYLENGRKQRQYRALPVSGRPYQSWDRALYLVRWAACGSSSR